MGLDSAIRLIESVSDMSVLFVGESIEDVYHYVTPLGRPPKELIISTQLQRTERYTGGIRAAAAHAASFCKTDVYTDRLLVKERWVEPAHMRKLFQCYTERRAVASRMPAYLDFDCIAVVDYGHGMIEEPVRSGVNFFAVNVQTNSENYGFNLATKYGSCDYLVVDEIEARLATGNRSGQIEDCFVILGARFAKVVITLGKGGAIGFDGRITRAPAFTDRIVDTLGAGDAFFAVTAPMAKTGSMADLLLIGNAAGALKAQIPGHFASVTKAALIAYLKANVPA